MFNALANALAGSSNAYANQASASSKKTGQGNNVDKNGKNRPSAAPSVLREDFYKAIQEAERWLTTSTPGDGYSFRPTHDIVFPHYPELVVPVACGPVEEVAILVGVLTDMALEIGFLDAYAGVITMRSWIDALDRVIKSWKARPDEVAGGRICEGIVQGVNYRADSTLLCKDFAPRVQTINILKTVAEAVYGKNSQEKKQSDALWSSRVLAL